MEITSHQNKHGIGYDPHRYLAEQYPDIVLRRTRMNDKVVGLTDGRTVVWLEERLDEVEERCVLCHEAVHIDLGHGTTQPPEVEQAVRAETARRLVTIDELIQAARSATSKSELAVLVRVMPGTLRDRLATLTTEESAALSALEVAYL